MSFSMIILTSPPDPLPRWRKPMGEGIKGKGQISGSYRRQADNPSLLGTYVKFPYKLGENQKLIEISNPSSN